LLTLDDICQTQALLMKEQARVGKIVPESAHGVIRGPLNRSNVRVGNHLPPYYGDVPALVDKYMLDLGKELMNPKMPVTEIAATYHVRFESIHPFTDGNGRTGRLVANYIMKYFEFPIIVFTYGDRKRYYEACQSKTLMREYFNEKYREYGVCLNGDNDLVKRVSEGIEADYYSCPTCGLEFAHDWEHLYNKIPVLKRSKEKP